MSDSTQNRENLDRETLDGQPVVRRLLPVRRPLVAASLLGAAVLAAGVASLQPLAAAAPAAPPASAPPSSMPASFADVVEASRPSVVTISTTARGEAHASAPQMPQGFPPGLPFGEQFRRFFEAPGQGPREMHGLGSGFIIDAGGLVVTNHHVIDGAEAITVVLHDGTELEARVRGVDPRTDLALLEVDAGRPLVPVRFGDSDRTRVGDWVIAVGNPFGLGGSYTAGIVSARGRDINAGPYDDFLQIDAPINRGNSGGALFNTAGEVVGVNTAIFSPNGGNVGIGFAVPARLARRIIDDLADDGRVERGWLGVHIQPVTRELADAMRLPGAEGALISRVEPGSPAARAGLQPGDVVLGMNGEPVADSRSLSRMVADAGENGDARLRLWRDGSELELAVALGALPDDGEPVAAGQGGEEPSLGLALAPLDAASRARLGYPEGTEGALIAGVQPGSVADRQGLRPGMLITRVGSEPVSDPAAAARALRGARRDHADHAVVLVADPRGGARFVALPLA